MLVFLTGSTGFVGQALVARLASQPTVKLIAATRRPVSGLAGGVVYAQVPEIAANTSWQSMLNGVQVVIHAAARVHVMNDKAVDALAEFRKVNVEGTLNLARQAAASGVRRFIFISSIKVNGEGAPDGTPYSADGTPRPADPYGISKMEAEQGLRALATETGMEVVIIRPPLVYGSGVKGNFAVMIGLIDKSFPLPFGAVHNKRSLIGIDNLVDLIVCCIDHLSAANHIFLASDGEDLSTTQLMRLLARTMGRPSRLIPVPTCFLEGCAIFFGKRALAQRLLGSLQVDISHTCELLGWTPPFTVEEGLRRCFAKETLKKTS